MRTGDQRRAFAYRRAGPPHSKTLAHRVVLTFLNTLLATPRRGPSSQKRPWRGLVAFWLLGLAFVAGDAAAQEDKSTSWLQVTGLVVAVEGAIAVNAYLASMNPKVYAGVAGVIYPIMIQPSTQDAWLVVGALETVPVYNLTIDPDKKSPSQIFKANEIAWHAAVGLLLTTGYVTKITKEKMSLGYMPEPHGGKLILSLRF